MGLALHAAADWFSLATRAEVNRLDDVVFGELLVLGERFKQVYGAERQETAYAGMRATQALSPELFAMADVLYDTMEAPHTLGPGSASQEANAA